MSDPEFNNHFTPEPRTADEIRSKLVDAYKQFEPQLKGFREYSERAEALALEFHRLKLTESFCLPEEMTLVASFDARQSPASLEAKLAQLPADLTIKRIIFDRLKNVYFLFA